MKASIIIRTLNEERYLGELITAIERQVYDDEIEIVVVDSGSTDSTLEIARKHQSKIVKISKEQFTFGRSLNLGCQNANGEALIIISGHCVPTGAYWLEKLVAPLKEKVAHYTYGRQIGGPTSKFSECRLFEKYYPPHSSCPQKGFFCNNANSAILKNVWQEYHFDEDIIALEDMLLAKALVSHGLKIGYVHESEVYHHHQETWPGVRRRYEREAIALQHIMPEIHLRMTDFFRYFLSGVLYDLSSALQKNRFFKSFKEILLFRFMQYWGSYRGNHEHRKLSKKQKESYFYPTIINGQNIESNYGQKKISRPATHEGQ